jgi:hypothetical protein
LNYFEALSGGPSEEYAEEVLLLGLTENEGMNVRAIQTAFLVVVRQTRGSSFGPESVGSVGELELGVVLA